MVDVEEFESWPSRFSENVFEREAWSCPAGVTECDSEVLQTFGCCKGIVELAVEIVVVQRLKLIVGK